MRRAVLFYLGVALALGCNSESQTPAGAGPGGDAGKDVRASSDAKVTADAAASQMDVRVMVDAGVEPDGPAGEAGVASDVGGGGSDTTAAAVWPEVTDYARAGLSRSPGTATPGRAASTTSSAPPAGRAIGASIRSSAGPTAPCSTSPTTRSCWSTGPRTASWSSPATPTAPRAGPPTRRGSTGWWPRTPARAAPYPGVLDANRIGAAGHSQGGGATIAAGSNKPGPTGIVATAAADAAAVVREPTRPSSTARPRPMLNINASMDNRDPTGTVANQIFAGAQRTWFRRPSSACTRTP